MKANYTSGTVRRKIDSKNKIINMGLQKFVYKVV